MSKHTHTRTALQAKGQDPFTHFAKEINGGLAFLLVFFQSWAAWHTWSVFVRIMYYTSLTLANRYMQSIIHKLSVICTHSNKCLCRIRQFKHSISWLWFWLVKSELLWLYWDVWSPLGNHTACTNKDPKRLKIHWHMHICTFEKPRRHTQTLREVNIQFPLSV